jgi:hypothetical protein
VPSFTRSYPAGSRGPLVHAPVAVEWWSWSPSDNKNAPV